VAGLLMFGKEEAIRDALPQYHIDYREKQSDNPSIRWTDRLTIDGTWSGNLFQFYLRVIQRLAADLKLPFQLDNNLFRQGETIVHEAIREVLVNSLIHADYQGAGGVVIEKYQNRFEFSNPGTLLISFDQLLRGNVSECRNKSLQTMFNLIGAAEKAGSGVDKILRGWESQHWRSPLVREQMQPDRVQWILPMISLIPQESLDRLQKSFKERFSNFTSLDVQALVTADLEGVVDNARMCQITGRHTSDMTKLLKNLVCKGALVQEGQGRWTQYRLADTFDSIHKDINSIHKDGNSIHKDGNTVHREELTADNMQILAQIAKPAIENHRLSPTQMKQIIIALLGNQWLTRIQLGKLLSRNPDGLRSRFLTPMVDDGFLEYRYPDKPNHTNQAYKVASSQNSSI
jgi:ATP-dependent DNA helicase RecG